MAKRYIEREALDLAISRNAKYFKDKSDFDHIGIVVMALPDADVVEVRHGEWLDNGERNRDGTLKPFTISCSVCGSSAGHSWMKYCPNCGAKMNVKKEAIL